MFLQSKNFFTEIMKILQLLYYNITSNIYICKTNINNLINAFGDKQFFNK